MGMKSSGEIVQVEGGHIIRSTGRKDRHSKVYTAKGPRDRRVRLSAHTAIQFYDVQDRLGYDRPSKAVDWLIHKAKSAIDKLEELPPWNPMEAAVANQGPTESDHHPENPSNGGGYPNFTFDDTMKSFFPTTRSSEVNFENYSGAGGDFMPRSSNVIQTNDPHHQDLCLSLHSAAPPPAGLYSTPASFENNYPRMVGNNWDTNATAADQNIKTGYFFNSHSHSQIMGQSSSFAQREPLQSSFLSRVWNDHHASNLNHSDSPHQFSAQFSGFQVPARIQGEHTSSVSTNTHHLINRD